MSAFKMFSRFEFTIFNAGIMPNIQFSVTYFSGYKMRGTGQQHIGSVSSVLLYLGEDFRLL